MSTWSQITAELTHEFSDLADVSVAVRVAFRLTMAVLLGAILGFERSTVGKSAGVRTHSLVALGSALFLLVPLQMGAEDDAVSRVVQGLVAGIGFLGAGAIVKGETHDEIHGLTTAAGIWTTAAIGMAVGLGNTLTAIIATVLALCVLRLLPGGGPNRRPPEISIKP